MDLLQIHHLITSIPALSSLLYIFESFTVVQDRDENGVLLPYTLEQTLYVQWRQVLETIRRIPPDAEGQVAFWTNEWVRLGARIGLNPNTPSENEVRAVTSYMNRVIPQGQCHWRDCLCSHHTPWHRMQECQGCRQVRYCSRKCQKRYVHNWDLA